MTKHTKDILAEALEAAGLHEMAEMARTGMYHDYLSPLAMPDVQLAFDLRSAAGRELEPNRVVLIMDVLDRHMNGEFDASKEESDEWAASPEGQAAFTALDWKNDIAPIKHNRGRPRN